MITALYKAITCIFEKALNTNADALVGGLICSVLNTVLKLMGPFGTIERNIIKEITDAIGIEFCSS